jgi:putative transposase
VPNGPNQRWSLDFVSDISRTVVGRLLRTHRSRLIIASDNSTETHLSTNPAMAGRLRVECHYIAPGKPMQNGLVDSVNGRFRDECLSEHSFRGLQAARQIVAAWRID